MKTLKKVILNLSAASLILLLGGLFLPSFAQQSDAPKSETTFSDVKANDSFHPIAEFLFDQEIFTGYLDGSFGPDNEITRAELLALLVRMKGLKPSLDDYNHCFSDIGIPQLDVAGNVVRQNPEDDWFVPSVCYAKAQGWVIGYEGDVFRPENPSTRAEALKMIMEVLFPDRLTAQMLSNIDSGDEGSVQGNWYTDYVLLANKMSIISSHHGYSDDYNASRKLVAEILFKSILLKENDWERFDSIQADRYFLKRGEEKYLSRSYPCYWIHENRPEFVLDYLSSVESGTKDFPIFDTGPFCLLENGGYLLMGFKLHPQIPLESEYAYSIDELLEVVSIDDFFADEPFATQHLVYFNAEGQLMDDQSVSCDNSSHLLFFEESALPLGADPNTIRFIDCYYLADENNIYFGSKTLELEQGLDNFQTLSFPYSTDGEHVYFAEQLIEEVDLKTLEIFPGFDPILNFAFFAKDANNVFVGGELLLEELDPAAFEMIAPPELPQRSMKELEFFDYLAHVVDFYIYFKDSTHVYREDEIMTIVGQENQRPDPETFELLSAFFAKDAQHVYLIGYDYGEGYKPYEDLGSHQLKIIQGADPKTFDAFVLTPYAKDETSVYFYDQVMEADPQTFRAVDSIQLDSRNRDFGHYYALDENHLYYRNALVEEKDFSMAELIQGAKHDEVWLRTDQGIYFNGKFVDEVAAPETFEFIGAYHAKDALKVYLAQVGHVTVIQGADPNRFELIEGSKDFSKDGTSVFYRSKKLEGVNPHSVEMVTESSYLHDYLKDENHVYFVEKEPLKTSILEGANPETFEVLTSPYTHQAFSKTNAFVYFYGNKVEEIHAPSFEVIDREYAKDQYNVYFFNENEEQSELKTLTNADPATFEILTQPYSPSSFARDENDVYHLGEVVSVEGIDPSSIQVVTHGKLKDDHAVYCKPDANHPWWILEGADPNTFVVHNGGQYSWDHDSYYSYCYRVDSLPDHVKDQVELD